MGSFFRCGWMRRLGLSFALCKYHAIRVGTNIVYCNNYTIIYNSSFLCFRPNVEKKYWYEYCKLQEVCRANERKKARTMT